MFKALQSGVPLSLPFSHSVSTVATPFMGSQFGQDIEPSGEYLSHHPYDHKPLMFGDPNVKSTGATYLRYGTVNFKNPFVVHVPRGGGTVDWKKSVSAAFGNKKGRALSDAMVKKGHDGIIAVDPDGSDIMEMVRFNAPVDVTHPFHPDGQAIYDIKAMSMKKSEPGVRRVASVAPFKDGKLLWGKRNDNGRWTMPGGHLNEGEDPKKGAVRELLEETGLKPTKLVYLGEKTINDGRLVVYSFKADVNAEPDGSSDPDEECSVWKWVDPSDIPEEILSNLHSRKNVTLEFLREEGSLEKDELWDDGEAEVHHINLANQDDMWVNEFAHGRAK